MFLFVNFANSKNKLQKHEESKKHEESPKHEESQNHEESMVKHFT